MSRGSKKKNDLRMKINKIFIARISEHPGITKYNKIAILLFNKKKDPERYTSAMNSTFKLSLYATFIISENDVVMKNRMGYTGITLQELLNDKDFLYVIHRHNISVIPYYYLPFSCYPLSFHEDDETQSISVPMPDGLKGELDLITGEFTVSANVKMNRLEMTIEKGDE